MSNDIVVFSESANGDLLALMPESKHLQVNERTDELEEVIEPSILLGVWDAKLQKGTFKMDNTGFSPALEGAEASVDSLTSWIYLMSGFTGAPVVRGIRARRVNYNA